MAGVGEVTPLGARVRAWLAEDHLLSRVLGLVEGTVGVERIRSLMVLTVVFGVVLCQDSMVAALFSNLFALLYPILHSLHLRPGDPENNHLLVFWILFGTLETLSAGLVHVRCYYLVRTAIYVILWWPPTDGARFIYHHLSSPLRHRQRLHGDE